MFFSAGGERELDYRTIQQGSRAVNLLLSRCLGTLCVGTFKNYSLPPSTADVALEASIKAARYRQAQLEIFSSEQSVKMWPLDFECLSTMVGRNKRIRHFPRLFMCRI